MNDSHIHTQHPFFTRTQRVTGEEHFAKSMNALSGKTKCSRFIPFDSPIRSRLNPARVYRRGGHPEDLNTRLSLASSSHRTDTLPYEGPRERRAGREGGFVQRHCI